MSKGVRQKSLQDSLPKSPSGIFGLDEITGGGLPLGRPTLVCGSAGCGKTLLAMEFLVRGATEFNEPGVFVAFEETGEELAQNVKSLGFDLVALKQQNKLLIDHVHLDRGEIEETGQYNLEGLFVRLGFAIDSIGAKRVVLDTIETLFSSLKDEGVLRTELQRLFRWLKDKGITAVVTAERGTGTLTRHGLEEYISDCVILLDHRVSNELSTRRLRVVKYRGSSHATNEFPFLIDDSGISVLPVTSAKLDHTCSSERISTGVPALDGMLGGKGYYRGSTVLFSGTAGTGKTTFGAAFAKALAERGEKCLFFAFEESQPQIIRNLRSIGMDLAPFAERGLIQFHNARPSLYGMEMHLVTMHRMLQEFHPQGIVVDPVSAFLNSGTGAEVKTLMTRLIDYFKAEGITAVLTALVASNRIDEESGLDVSSLLDTWISVRDLEVDGERQRSLHVLKSRGMAHSNRIEPFHLADDGIHFDNQDRKKSARDVQSSGQRRRALSRAKGRRRR